VVAGYSRAGSEIDPAPVMAELARRAGGALRLALPATTALDAPLSFRAWAPGQALAPDLMGLAAPPASAPAVRPDLVIAPLLAFDARGGRLGQGGGHYDRTLAALRAHGPVFVLGLAFAGQEVEALELAPHDQRLDAVLTDEGYRAFEQD